MDVVQVVDHPGLVHNEHGPCGEASAGVAGVEPAEQPVDGVARDPGCGLQFPGS